MSMVDGVGLSVGATNLTAVVVGRTAVTRSAVLTLFPNRPPEVGVPSENPRLNSGERGLIITDFVDRVGDPVGIIASDGSTHRGEVLLADALRALLYEVTNGRDSAGPVAVSYPAHWPPSTVDALRGALAQIGDFSRSGPVALISDASAALTALQDEPGVPTRGVVALCDFGGTGTDITLFDGGRQLGPTVRHTDLSGDLIDQALLTHVLAGLSDAGSIDVSGTSAIGALSRLRGQCRAAKERLSTTVTTSLVAELPAYRGDVRLTRNELDDAIRGPLTEFAVVLQETLDRSGAGPGDLVAVASAGGGARIPFITTTLSERFRVPVITTPQPELTAAIGAGLSAARGTAEEGATAIAPGLAAAAPAAALDAMDATQMAPGLPPEDVGSSTFRALAWSEADDIPDVAVTDPYDYQGMAGVGAVDAPRPQMQFAPEPETEAQPAPGRRPIGLLIGFLVLALAAVAVAVWFALRNSESTPSPATTTVTTTTTAAPPTTSAPPPTSEAPPPPPPVTETVNPPQQTVTQTQAPPPPTSEAPPPTSEAPPPPPTSEAPPTSQAPSTSERPRLIPTLPYETIPGLPFVPAPIQPQQP